MTTETIEIPTSRGTVQALADVPADAAWLLVLAHGAGAGMRHRFMNAVSRRFNEAGLAVLRYEYPYVTAGSKRPDPPPMLESATRQVVEFAAGRYAGLRIAAGGKSMGGRMTSRAQSAAPLARTEALFFLGFPLHIAGKPGVERAEHLDDVHIPMLFLQGTRDTLADLELMRTVTSGLPTATLHVVEGADHGFSVLKRSGRTDAQVLDELADTLAAWLSRI